MQRVLKPGRAHVTASAQGTDAVARAEQAPGNSRLRHAGGGHVGVNDQEEGGFQSHRGRKIGRIFPRVNRLTEFFVHYPESSDGLQRPQKADKFFQRNWNKGLGR